jgi:hypothetical protein
MSKQPRDDGNDPIPVLGYKQGGGQIVPFTGAESNSSAQISDSVRVVTLYSTVDAMFETGSAADTADQINSHFLPAGIPYDISLGPETAASLNHKHILVIGSNTNNSGTLYISERN